MGQGLPAPEGTLPQLRMGLLAKALCSGGRVKPQTRTGLLAKAFRSGGRVKPRPYG